MATKAEQLKSERIDHVVGQAQERLSRDKAEAAAAFVRRFYANVSSDDVVARDAEQLYGAALALWQFGAQRPADTAKVRVYTPQLALHGWQAGHTVVEIVNDDMPFLVDSVTAELNRRNLTVHLVIHPVVRVLRDAEGRLAGIADAGDPAGVPDSFMHVEVDEQSDPEVLEEIRAGIEAVLADVRASVRDWQQMRDRLAQVIGEIRTGPTPAVEEERQEVQAFLEWLDDNHFTFLGYREYRFAGAGDEAELSVVEGAGLGILADDRVSIFDGLRNFASLPPDIRFFLREPRLLLVTKSNRRATVHRPVHMDSIFVKTFDETGKVTGERLFLGLFTSAAYSRSPREIPFLRHKVARIFGRAGFDPRSHDGKALAHILETFPRDELFQISDDELYDIAVGVLHLQERQRTALFVRKDPFERFVSCLVYVPRDRYDTDLRRRIQAILERSFGGASSDFYTQLDDSALARVHFFIRTEPGTLATLDIAAIEAQLIEASRAWADRLQDVLVAARGEEAGLRLARRYGNAFTSAYRERFSIHAAVADIERLEEVAETGRLGLNLYRPLEAAPHELRFKIFHVGAPVPLSDVLPMLEHMDLKVVSEIPFEIRPGDGRPPVWIHDFETATRGQRPVDLAEVQDAFQETFAAVWGGTMESDGFNRLVLRAGLAPRQVVVLRAFAKFLRQARFAFSQDVIEDTLAAYPAIARLIVRRFLALHDPAETDRELKARGLAVEIDHALDAVENLDEDRILRRFVNLVSASLRTNYFQPGADGQPKPYLSVKLDSRAIDELPLPRPLVEIFVYSPRVEAVHLRGGKVARGGIRWSDRREDFRTEILGLMKAQMVKNAVIVPVGSKGGFVVKQPPQPDAGRDALMAEVVACYRTLMSGMLDLTDNLGPDGAVVPPRDVVRRDGDDPYLVVAADKGTATFSDIANGVARDYGFWLDDAFASGGSAGYDHKKMGITARGAWESVKRHFRELGRDIQTTPFTCVGVGDMSGDVFGNGMLLSPETRMVGAFNHLHIICDPNPDPAVAFAERKRLFELPRSNWTDYSPQCLSPGGAVFDRKAKSLTLSPEIRACFGIADERVTPQALIQAMLRAQVDLLWFGGIGTFIKAPEESHADVGDKANDALRIDADEVRALVVGEGANLGVTQPARVAFARRGGRINTDAIDNSAGVDTSDHEVNIKILLGDVVARGDMTLKQRDRLLQTMTDEVAELVLADNYLQTQVISVEAAAGPDQLENHAAFMRALERQGHLDRVIERLPDDEELARRAQAREGLTRPEIAVLLAYAKITLYDQLLASDLTGDPRLVDELVGYFPKVLGSDFRAAIDRHRLRREIIANVLTNEVVNRVGPTFVFEMADKTGAPPAEIVRAYSIVRRAFALDRLWASIEGLDNRVPASCQIAMLGEIRRLLERGIDWFLTHGGHPLDIAAETASLAPGVALLADTVAGALADDDRAALDGRAGALTREGVPDELASAVARLPVMAAAFDVTRIAAQTGHAVPEVAALYLGLGERFGIEWLREQAAGLPAHSHWLKQAIAAVIDDLFAHQALLTVRALSGGGLDAFLAAEAAAITRLEQLLGELRAASAVDLAMLTVANRRIHALAA